MIYLTDRPDTTVSFLPEGSVWSPMPDTSESDHALWQLYAQSPAWQATGSADSDRRILLVDHAPTSQFDDTLLALKSGIDLPDHLVCLALEGARFRGQRERPWTALRGNLHLTTHVRLNSPARYVETGLTMLPVVAAAQAIRVASDGRVLLGVKWMNDLLLEGRKVAGVLTATQLQGNVMERAVFGIGINVAHAPDIQPTPYAPPAGSLAGLDISLPRLFAALVDAIDENVQLLREKGSAPLFEQYRAQADFLEREVWMWPEHSENRLTEEPILRGRVLDLLPDLSLIIEGHPEPIRKGRLTYAP